MTNLKKGNSHDGFKFFVFWSYECFYKTFWWYSNYGKEFFRNIIAAFFAFIIIYKKGIKLKIKKHTLSNLIIRSIAGTLGILCNFYGVDHLLLADASILNKLSPFFAIIFSYLLIKEKISLKTKHYYNHCLCWSVICYKAYFFTWNNTFFNWFIGRVICRACLYRS